MLRPCCARAPTYPLLCTAPAGLACIWYGLLRYGGSSMHDEDWSFDVTLAYYDKKDAAAAAMAALAGAGLDSNGTVGNSSSTGDGNSTRHRSLLGFARQLHGLGTPLVESEASVGAYEASPPSLLSIYIVNYYNSFLLLVGGATTTARPTCKNATTPSAVSPSIVSPHMVACITGSCTITCSCATTSSSLFLAWHPQTTPCVRL